MLGNSSNDLKAGKLPRRRKLVTVFVLSLGILVLLANGLEVAFITARTRSSVSKQYTDNCKEIVTAYSIALSDLMNGYMKELIAYAEADVVKSGDTGQIVSWMESHQNYHGTEFISVLYVDSDGKGYTDKGQTVDVSDRDYYRAIFKAGKDQFVGDATISRTSGDAVVHVARAVKVNDWLVGIFVGVVPLDSISSLFNSVKIGGSGYPWLIGSDGTVMAHPQSEWIMKQNLLTDPPKGHEDMRAVIAEMVKGKSASAWVKGFTDAQDLVVYSPVKGTSWSLAFSIGKRQTDYAAAELANMMVGASAVMIALLLLLSAGLIRRMIKPLEVVGKTITGIASGSADLTKRIEVKANNEIGSVVSGFNMFTEKLQTIIRELKESRKALDEAGEELKDSTEDTAASITEIIANIESMSTHITNQASGVEETAGAVNEIAANIQSLNHMIEGEAAGVAQASAAIEEMIANVESVDASVEKLASAYDSLQKSAFSGIEKQEDVGARIKQIESESAMLEEANSAIANIASQTNLLAMNAAIEAAHAGEAGKGFSVVADEIRKLSETSSTQSKTIGEQLKNIEETIAGIVSASDESSQSFAVVADNIKQTDGLVRQIKEAMAEQNEGSKQISGALHSMNDSMAEVRGASAEMSAGNKAILEEVKELQNSTVSMRDGMSEMGVGARKINETGAALSGISSRLKTNIDKIGSQIDKFKV